MNQFMLFFKMHCLGLGYLTFDDSFLEEKRTWSLKELKTCNALLTRGADSCSPLTAHQVFTDAQIEYTMDKQLYPEALGATFGTFDCNFGCDPEVPPCLKEDRRDRFKRIFKEEQMSVLLHLEKLCFEGHFALAVAFCAHEAKRIDDMADFKLRHDRSKVSYADEDHDQSSRNADDDCDCEDRQWPLPLEKFETSMAQTVYDTRYDPESVSHDVRLHAKRDIAWLNSPYGKAMSNIKHQMTSGRITNGINDMHSHMRLLHKYFADGCTPAEAADAANDVKIIDPTHWDEIFGNLTPGTTVGDLHKNVESLYECWIKFVDPPGWKSTDTADSKQASTVCFDQLEAPVVYACAMLLEFYDIAMFTAMYASGNTR